nr:MAG TPA: hypothetical protein [Caudoviricetes sp.]
MHMRYGILDASAGRESLTALFFSDMHPHARPGSFYRTRLPGFLFCDF